MARNIRKTHNNAFKAKITLERYRKLLQKPGFPSSLFYFLILFLPSDFVYVSDRDTVMDTVIFQAVIKYCLINISAVLGLDRFGHRD